MVEHPLDISGLTDDELLERMRIHCEKHKVSGRATFSVKGIERLLKIIYELQHLRH